MMHYLHFSFKKHVSSQVLKDCPVENLETAIGIFFSKFFSVIYLSQIINCWGTLYVKLYVT